MSVLVASDFQNLFVNRTHHLTLHRLSRSITPLYIPQTFVFFERESFDFFFSPLAPAADGTEVPEPPPLPEPLPEVPLETADCA